MVGSGRCIRILLLCSLVVPRGPSMYTGQEYTARPAGCRSSLAPGARALTLTGGRGLGWPEGLSCKAPASGSHSAFRSCSPIRSTPISGALGFGPLTTWGRQKPVRQGSRPRAVAGRIREAVGQRREAARWGNCEVASGIGGTARRYLEVQRGVQLLTLIGGLKGARAGAARLTRQGDHGKGSLPSQ